MPVMLPSAGINYMASQARAKELNAKLLNYLATVTSYRKVKYDVS